jgi:hypothetical protein
VRLTLPAQSENFNNEDRLIFYFNIYFEVESAETRKARLEKQSLNNLDVEEAYERLNEKRERRDDMHKKLKQIEAESGSKLQEQSRLTKERRKAHKYLQKAKLSVSS